jgi:hypothetical protein
VRDAPLRTHVLLLLLSLLLRLLLLVLLSCCCLCCCPRVLVAPIVGWDAGLESWVPLCGDHRMHSSCAVGRALPRLVHVLLQGC